MMKPLATAALVLVLLAGCTPTGDEPVETPSPSKPVETTAAPPEPTAAGAEPLPDGAYLRIRATAHPVSGGALDLVLTVFEPTAEAVTAAATIDAISAGCVFYEQEHAYRNETEPGIEHYYSTSDLQVTGDAVVVENAVMVLGLGLTAVAETGSAVLPGVSDCGTYIGNAGSATLFNYFNNFGYPTMTDLLQWQFVGFADVNGPAATAVTFDNCSVEYGEQALTVLGGEYDWKLRDEGWRCEVAPYEYE